MRLVTLVLRGISVLCVLGFIACLPWQVWISRADYDSYGAYLAAKDDVAFYTVLALSISAGTALLSIVTDWIEEEFFE